MLVLKLITFLLPWPLRRRTLELLFGFKLHRRSRIGIAWVFPKRLVMDEGASIGHFTVGIHLDEIVLGRNAKIGRSNWITGFPSGTDSPHFRHQSERTSYLHMGDESAITKKHHIDCTSGISIGRYTTIAGYNSQFLTHSINLAESRQESAPIIIGDYCFVGTNCVLLGGSALPEFAVLGAKALLNQAFEKGWTLYGGVPAKPIKEIRRDSKYFYRKKGFVY